MRVVKSVLFCFISFFISTFILNRIADDHNKSAFLSFIINCFAGVFVLLSAYLMEILVAKKRQGEILKELRKKDYFWINKKITTKFSRQFYLVKTLDGKECVLGKIISKNEPNNGTILYYHPSLGFKGKIRAYEKKEVFIVVYCLSIILFINL
jgi:hypothetical protein